MKINQSEPHLRRSRRSTLLLVGCGALLFIGPQFFAACSLVKGKAEPVAVRTEGVPVTTAAVTQKTVPLQVRAIGTVEPSSIVGVKAQVGGELIKVNFTEGQFVKRGDLLFLLDPRPFESSLKQAEANLAKSTAQEKQAEATLSKDLAVAKTAEVQAQRYASLVKSGVVSNDQYDQFRTTAEALAQTVQADTAAVETAKQVIGADRAAVETAKLQLGFTSIYSPIDGRTGSLVAYQGNLVKANDTTPMVVIHQVNPINVSFAVPEKQLPEVKEYMAKGKLTVETAPSGDEAHRERGTVSFVDNAVDNTTGTIKLKATFANQERRLWPGQYANIALNLATQPNAVVVPSSAVQTGQQGQFVFVLKPDQTVEMRPVVIARTIDNDSIVESGVVPGEIVVTDGQLRLVPGAKVKVKNGAESAAADKDAKEAKPKTAD